MGALPANLSIGSMFRVLALLCLAVLSMGEPEAEAKAVADPKADPYLLYGGYYGLGLGHYGGYYGYPYYGYYGKRSAEAEPVSAPDADAKAEPAPKAEADPYLLYGYYGLGHHYGGYYGYPYWLWPRLLLWQVRRVEIQSRADKDEVPRFLTTTCLIFSTSEKSKCSKQNFFKLAAFKHLYILSCGIFAVVYLLSPLKPQERTRNVWF